MAKLATLFGEQIINSSTVKQLFGRMWMKDFDPVEIVEKEGLAQINDREVLDAIVEEVLKSSDKLINDYRNGKGKAFEALMGKAMGLTSGKANPVVLAELLKNRL